eukprot:NODE_3375_length_781_cov_96.247268_g1573_i1.p2 GENE.NODE_3375_length_781_cov_96.247268_g1573_i1~~NODE_3375_length_781_cov_96.247268_g1573_i1.p2  ORF type:complete len:148 (+),score=28.34 NODE_3375_length_781_cov_96.247268_g1573_i1:287-730(+)
MRKPEQRKGRSCIRPEFPRSKHTGGREGTSRDQFATMMRGMALSDSVVNWDHKNLDYLRRPQYDRWLRRLLDQAEAVDLTAVESYAGHGGEFKIYYADVKNSFKRIAMQLGLMSDEKENLPRDSYNGTVTFRRGKTRIHLVPESGPF